MKLESSRFGTVEIPDNKIITFPEGLLGFPEAKRYAILEQNEHKSLAWLLSIDVPDLAFVIIDPTTFIADYHVELPVLDVEKLQLDDDSTTAIFAIAVIPDDPKEMTANIKGPLVINIDKMIGRQVILDKVDYSVRHKVFPQDQNRMPEKRPEVQVCETQARAAL